MTISNTPNLTQVLTDFFMSMISDIHTVMLGRVEKFDADKQTVAVQPLLKKAYKDGNLLQLPQLIQVPIIFPQTQDSIIYLPIKKGDFVVLLFAERSIDEPLQNGKEAVAEGGRRFSLSDAVAIPGFLPFSQRTQVVDKDAALIKYKDTTITMKSNGDVTIKSTGKVTIDSSNISLGNTAQLGLLTEAFKTIMYDLHTHPTTTPGSPTGVPVPIPDPTGTSITSKTKAE